MYLLSRAVKRVQPSGGTALAMVMVLAGAVPLLSISPKIILVYGGKLEVLPVLPDGQVWVWLSLAMVKVVPYEPERLDGPLVLLSVME